MQSIKNKFKVKIKSVFNPELSRRAFTLVEVLVATVILVIVIGGFASVETANIKTGTSSKYTIQANALDQQDMNIVKSIIDKATLTKDAAIPADRSAQPYDYNVNGNGCTDPSNPTNCPIGFYYINSSNKLIMCPPNSVVPVSPLVSKNVCKYAGTGPSDQGALKVIDGKTFYRSVELK